jgi:hypothetical protein
MPRTDLAELYASKLDRLPPAPDSDDDRELRLFEFASFGQAEDVKKRTALRAQDIGKRLVHIAESHGYTISHPSDPIKVAPSGKRIASLTCANCRKSFGQLTIDDGGTVSVHPTALKALATMEHHCA